MVWDTEGFGRTEYLRTVSEQGNEARLEGILVKDTESSKANTERDVRSMWGKRLKTNKLNRNRLT